MAQSAGLPSMDEGPRIYIPQSVVTKIDSFSLPRDFVVINCTSNAEEKSWSKEKWERLLRDIQRRYNIPVYEIGLKPFIEQTDGLCTNLCGQLSILESAEVIRRAHLFIGIDSGPAHLANAAGTPGVILLGDYLGFSKYNPFSGSYGKHINSSIIFSDSKVGNINPARVFSSVERFLSQRH